jgi:hypothetical protein
MGKSSSTDLEPRYRYRGFRHSHGAGLGPGTSAPPRAPPRPRGRAALAAPPLLRPRLLVLPSLASRSQPAGWTRRKQRPLRMGCPPPAPKSPSAASRGGAPSCFDVDVLMYPYTSASLALSSSPENASSSCCLLGKAAVPTSQLREPRDDSVE